MNLFPCITQTAREHKLHLRMHILNAFLNNKFIVCCRDINTFQFGKEQGKLLFGKQSDTLQHRNVRH
ncbi:hypothetical protein Barb7_01576 [Bacteroidales bacterium Barb7]|nr:hypothetical protein Barb7_01576 [Bacteroidales bacterium Barb7]